MRLRQFILILVTFLIISNALSFAAVLRLKDGTEVKVTLIELTESRLRVSLHGMKVTSTVLASDVEFVLANENADFERLPERGVLLRNGSWFFPTSFTITEATAVFHTRWGSVSCAARDVEFICYSSLSSITEVSSSQGFVPVLTFPTHYSTAFVQTTDGAVLYGLPSKPSGTKIRLEHGTIVSEIDWNFIKMAGFPKKLLESTPSLLRTKDGSVVFGRVAGTANESVDFETAFGNRIQVGINDIQDLIFDFKSLLDDWNSKKKLFLRSGVTLTYLEPGSANPFFEVKLIKSDWGAKLEEVVTYKGDALDLTVSSEPFKKLAEFSAPAAIRSTPALSPDGKRLYVGTVSGRFYAIDTANLEVVWRLTFGAGIYGSPAVAPNGTIYIGSYDDRLYAISPDGVILWSVRTGGDVYSSPAIGPDGTVYFGSRDDHLYAVDQNGNIKWKFKTIDDVDSSPAIDFDGTIYFGSDDGNLYALNPDGSLKWKFETGGAVFSSPAIGPDRTIYFASLDNHLYAISHEGKLLWKRYVTFSPSGYSGRYIIAGVIIGLDGTIYVGDFENYLNAFYPDGRLKWRFKTSGWVRTAPAIGSDGLIYFGSRDGNFYAVNSDGELVWKLAIGGSEGIASSVTFGDDGAIYFGDWQGRLYKVKSNARGLASGTWPKFRCNNYNDGSVYTKGFASPTPRFPNPPNGSVNVTPFVLSWYAKPHQGKLTFDVYLGTSKDAPLVAANVRNNYIDAGFLKPGTKYFWRVVAKDEFGNSFSSPLWEFTTEAYRTKSIFIGAEVTSGPAFGSDGTIYVGTKDAGLYAVLPNGRVRWSFKTAGPVFSAPCIASDGKVYFGSDDGNLYVVDKDGNLVWKFRTNAEIRSSPAVTSDGTVFVGSLDGHLYALNKSGELLWRFNAGAGINTGVVVGSNGNVYFGSLGGVLYALDRNGRMLWNVKLGGLVSGNLSIGTRGEIYVLCNNNTLYALTPTGTVRWSFSLSTTDFAGGTIAVPIVGTNGNVYIGDVGGAFYALLPDGKLLWTFRQDAPLRTSPVLFNSGLLAILAGDGKIYMLNTTTGQQTVVQDVGFVPSTNLGFSNDGLLVYGAQKYLVVIPLLDQTLPNSGWPIFRKNPACTGV